MPAIDNLNDPSSDITGQLSKLKQQVKDLANNNIQAPFALTVGLGGITDLGPATLQGGATVTGGETVDTLNVTGTATLHGTSATSLSVSGTSALGHTTVAGGLSPDTISSSSDITCGGKLFDPDGATFNITGTRVTTWMETATGRFGNTASSRRYKQDIADAQLDMLAVLKVIPYRFHYIDEIRKRDDPTFEGYVGPNYQVALEYGFMAEDLAAAGLNQWVYLDTDGQPDSVNYVMWVVALQAVVRAQAMHIRGLEADMAAVKAKLGL